MSLHQSNSLIDRFLLDDRRRRARVSSRPSRWRRWRERRRHAESLAAALDPAVRVVLHDAAAFRAGGRSHFDNGAAGPAGWHHPEHPAA